MMTVQVAPIQVPVYARVGDEFVQVGTATIQRQVSELRYDSETGCAYVELVPNPDGES